MAKNVKQAYKMCDKSCSLNSGRACGFVGGYFLKYDKQPKKAIKYLEKSCTDLKYALSCKTLEAMYGKGALVKKDIRKAQKYKSLGEAYSK